VWYPKDGAVLIGSIPQSVLCGAFAVLYVTAFMITFMLVGDPQEDGPIRAFARKAVTLMEKTDSLISGVQRLSSGLSLPILYQC
jgi:hypothetical protein